MLKQSHNLVILGANSDIGGELVRQAASRSERRVLAVSRSPAAVGITDPPNVERLAGLDLIKEIHLRRLAAKTSGKFHEPFAVIHSVGNFWIHKPLVETPFHEIREMIESQLLTLMGVARVLTPAMIKNGGGALVAFSCNSVTYNYPDMSPFTASKAAIESFVKCYANEHAEFGISACALALPTIRTAKVLKEKPRGDHENYIKPEDLANYILNHILTQPQEVNGNVIKVFKHSPTFYHKSYYERNPRRRNRKRPPISAKLT